MKKIQQFSTWFSAQSFIVKLGIGIPSGLVLCCLGGFLLVTFNPSVPAPETKDVSSVQTAAIETAIADINQTATSNATVNTIEPTSTSSPSISMPANEIEVFVDVYSILGKPIDEVEALIGPTILITPNDDNEDNLSGGEYRDYRIGKYDTSVAYDKDGIARVFQVMDGLSDENYSIVEWNLILPKFGVLLNSPPEREAPAAVYWDNYDGYFVAVAASNTSGKPVWTVQIAEAEYAP